MPHRKQARAIPCDFDDIDFAEMQRETTEVQSDNDELRWQVELLTQRMDKVLHMQRQFDDVTIVDENPFADPQNRSPERSNHRW
ncbi:unnamed protein product [Linum trigynum]|uniref:Uncharacterized protein n=1 Tax=Linum trigynum TaxID=586398 RepID=A0AAV2E8L3_9ROSI